MTHTKTPWAYDGDGFDSLAAQDFDTDGYTIFSKGPNDVIPSAPICEICPIGNDEECEANAAFIVRACNNFEELLEELKSVLRYKDTCPYCDGSGEPQSAIDDNGRCENCGGMGYVVLPFMACEFSFIEKLIAKAESSSPSNQ